MSSSDNNKKIKILHEEDDYYNEEYEDDFDDDQKQFLQNENNIYIELIFKIQSELIKYVSEGNNNVLPLCEFLTVKDVGYFLNCLE